MYMENQRLIFSPSDLVVFMESPFASWMDRKECVEFVATRQLRTKIGETKKLQLALQARGIKHEKQQLASFLAQGLKVVDIKASNQGFEASQQATLQAMQQGIDIIYQAALEGLPWRGYADFLVKVAGTSALGNYYYEVWDTKLALNAKPNAVIQLCCYSDLLSAIQQRLPDYLKIVTGSSKNIALKVENYRYYYLSLAKRFLAFHAKFKSNNMPNPVDTSSFGHWSKWAEQWLTEQDHLSLIANITRVQICKLNKAGIHNCEELITTPKKYITGINIEMLAKLKAQAKLQKDSLGKSKPLFELLPVVEGQGLTCLPPAHEADVFFDIEGFPLEEAGLEYLWGCTYFEEGQRCFRDFWAHNAVQEKQAFSEFIQWVYARWRANPAMHIYHYASYEITACKKLMGRYGLYEHEVDELLRHQVFIDLYRIVKTALRVGEPRYSIKNIEHLYRHKRDTEVSCGGDSVVMYEGWCLAPDGNTWQDSAVLKAIRDYNQEDCESTQELTEWLRQQQTNAGIVYTVFEQIEEESAKDNINEKLQLRDKLLTRARNESEEQAALSEHLAWSLEFHRREAKPIWWRLFERQASTLEELLDDEDCLAACYLKSIEPFKPTAKARNLAYTFQVPNQTFKYQYSDKHFEPKFKYFDGQITQNATWLGEYSDLTEGRVVVQLAKPPATSMALLPDEYVNPRPIPQALQSVAGACEQGQPLVHKHWRIF